MSLNEESKLPDTFSTISSCRLCGSRLIDSAFSLGWQRLSNFVAKEDVYTGPLVPIELVCCQDCTLVQLRHTAPQELLYTRHYWYRSGVTQSMRNYLEEVTLAAGSRVGGISRNDVVLDIGSNDGTLLRAYRSGIKVGVEPATNLAEEGSKGVDHFISDFWNSKRYWEVMNKPAKVITALGMFYDLDDPNQFIADVSQCLAEDGVFIAQLMCLQNMLNMGDVGNLAHEHLEFYTLKSLDRLFNANGLRMVDLERNAVNGQSYRLYVVRSNEKNAAMSESAALVAARAQEECSHEELMRRLKLFYKNAQAAKEACMGFIRSKVNAGKKIYVYGASTKGNTILQWYGLNQTYLKAAADRSPEKWGKYTIGTGIPICSEEQARRDKPDYFLVLPYAFIDEFVTREQGWLRQGGTFIVPLPEPYTVSHGERFVVKKPIR